MIISNPALRTDRKITNVIDFSRLVPNRFGCTPLHKAAGRGDVAELAILLQNKFIHVNTTDILGPTPLHYAAHQGKTNCMKLLLSYPKINININDISRKILLTLAQQSLFLIYIKQEIIALLTSHGATR